MAGKRPYWAMGGITNEGVEGYLYGLLPERDEVQAEQEKEAEKRKIPIVGPAVGRVFYQLAKMIGARTVFEMGSAIGYSTLWLARAVGPKGVVYYTDGDPANAERAQNYLRRGGVLSRVRLLTGDALELLKSTPGQFDLIFNDVNKVQYPEVFRLALPRLRAGGLFITDNVLWSGWAARPAASDAETSAIQKFNRLVYRSPRLFTTIVPLRDGLAVCVKEK